jgi:hypothetical protein
MTGAVVSGDKADTITLSRRLVPVLPTEPPFNEVLEAQTNLRIRLDWLFRARKELRSKIRELVGFTVVLFQPIAPPALSGTEYVLRSEKLAPLLML